MYRELFLERLIMLEVDCRCHGLADYPTEICHKLLSSSFCTTNSANTTGSAGSYGTNGIPVWTCSMVYSCSEPKSKLIAWGATCNRGLIGISGVECAVSRTWTALSDVLSLYQGTQDAAIWLLLGTPTNFPEVVSPWIVSGFIFHLLGLTYLTVISVISCLLSLVTMMPSILWISVIIFRKPI